MYNIAFVKYLFILSILLVSISCRSESDSIELANDTSLIQLSGLILTADSLMSLPYTAIKLSNRNRGTHSDLKGFFSLVVEIGDTIEFSFLGFHTKKYVVPDSLIPESRYSIIQLMTQDPIYLNETMIYPWNSREQFKEAFIHTPIPNDDLVRAQTNLHNQRLKDLGRYDEIVYQSASDQYLRQHAEQLSYLGQPAPANFVNPFAWAKFIKAWTNGAFKK